MMPGYGPNEFQQAGQGGNPMPFSEGAFRHHMRGAVQVSGENLNWPGLMACRVSLPPCLCTSPALTEPGVSLTLSQPHACQRRMQGEPLQRGYSAPGVVHIIPADREARWLRTAQADSVLMFFRPGYIESVAREAFDHDTGKIELEPRFGIHDSTIRQLAQLALRGVEVQQPTSAVFVESLATKLAVHLLRNYSPRLSSGSDIPGTDCDLPFFLLRRVADYIEAHIDTDLSLSELAKLCDYSSYHFLRLFRNTLHITPHQYILERRIDRACDMLKRRQASAVEIAVAVGFSSQSHFANAFKKWMGVTPGIFQNP